MLDLDLFLELIHQGQLLNQAYNVNKSRCYFTILHNGEIGSDGVFVARERDYHSRIHPHCHPKYGCLCVM
jgi:hypothetical protein